MGGVVGEGVVEGSGWEGVVEGRGRRGEGVGGEREWRGGSGGEGREWWGGSGGAGSSSPFARAGSSPPFARAGPLSLFTCWALVAIRVCWALVAVRACWGLVAVRVCWALVAVRACWCWDLVASSSVVFICRSWVVFGSWWLWLPLCRRCPLSRLRASLSRDGVMSSLSRVVGGAGPPLPFVGGVGSSSLVVSLHCCVGLVCCRGRLWMLVGQTM